MGDSKKYYYLKLKDNFFDTDEMIVLESMPDGYLYSNILLKLYLRSLKNEGKLMFNDRIPFNSTMLAQITRHNVGVIEKAMRIFKELNLIEVLDTGAIYMLDIQNFIGESSTEADRKRAYRARIENEKHLIEGQMSDKCPDKSPPEIEIEIEIEIEKEYSAFFEEVWKLYPNKKGKGRISDSRKKEIHKLGDEFKKCIERYKEYVENQRINGFKDLKYQNGSTFFNSGYVDYLDENYQEVESEDQEHIEKYGW